VIIGKSGASYGFPVTAEKGKRRVAVDIVVAKKEKETKDRVVQSVMKKLDISDVDIIVACAPGVGEEPGKLAQLLGVSLISVQDTIGAVAALRKILSRLA
jgi:hypothetical protein